MIRQPKHDSIRNGVIIGGAIGAGLGVISELSCGGNPNYCAKPGWLTLGTTIWGVGIGMSADILHKTPRDIFRHGADSGSTTLTVAPVVSRHAGGAQVALRW